MPELPEVETIVRGLKSRVFGLKTKSLEVNIPKWQRQLREDGLDPDKDIVGHKISNVRRVAKMILLDLDNGCTVIFHLKMTGQLIFEDPSHHITPGGHPIPSFNLPQPNKSTHAIFTFGNRAHLYFNDSRMFGFMKLVPTKKVDEVSFIKTLGPEPFDPAFTEEVFLERIKKRSRMNIKALLLDQKFLSGIGNIYANEALWEARIHPLRLAGTLDISEIKELYKSIKKVLDIGIKNKGTTLSDFVDVEGNKGGHQSFLNAHNQEGERCPRDDGGLIKRIVIGGRGTFFCPVCQKLMSTDSISVLDQVRAGMLVGRAALDALNREGKYVFHGSSSLIKVLRPRRSINHSEEVLKYEPGGVVAVFATDEPEIAVFMALQNKAVNGWSSFSSRKGNFAFSVSPEKWEYLNSDDARGYVYVLDRNLFTCIQGEFRSGKEVQPISVVGVTRKDLSGNIKKSTDWPSI
jgi:formamidopyrimidine-DNA glycosylase